MSNLFIAHHGILGQKWGQRNGPPYPLDEDDLSVAERKADTGEIKRDPGDGQRNMQVSSKNARDVAGTMSNSQLRQYAERLELENRYVRAVQAQEGKSFFEKTVDTMGKVAQLTESTNKVIQFATGKSFSQNIQGLIQKNAKKKSLWKIKSCS